MRTNINASLRSIWYRIYVPIIFPDLLSPFGLLGLGAKVLLALLYSTGFILEHTLSGLDGERGIWRVKGLSHAHALHKGKESAIGSAVFIYQGTHTQYTW